MIRFYNREGNEIGLLEWVKTSVDLEYKVVKRTEVGKTSISTVWSGLDHNFRKGPPLIFQTMIFDKDSELDQWQKGYSTLGEAEAGHLRAVALVKKVKKK